MNIGIYGGAFDPPHLSHVWAVGYALSVGGFDKVLVVPCLNHAFGKQMTRFEDREEMCLQAFSIYGDRVQVSDVEYEIQSRYTSELMDHLIKTRPGDKFSLIIGEDEWAVFHKWHDYESLLKKVGVLVVGREGFRPELVQTTSRPALPNISSSQIREEIRQTGLAVFARFRVPQEVLLYIKNHKLYGACG